jgi:ABC transporter with metal-binding/Fe-S-binding domain ATP-binding protein
MRLASLFSGGKDSTFATYLMEQSGQEVPYLVTIVPKDPYAMLFHTLNLEAVPLHAQSMGKELVSVASSGLEDEDLEALRVALAGMEIDGVITGAIASDYQWDRINRVCEGMGLRCFSPLWRKDQELLLRDMVQAGVRAMIVGTFAEGLDQQWLGRIIDERTIIDLKAVSGRSGINISGEGGEYETLAFDSPLHSCPLELLGQERQVSRDSSKLIIKNPRLAGHTPKACRMSSRRPSMSGV